MKRFLSFFSGDWFLVFTLLRSSSVCATPAKWALKIDGKEDERSVHNMHISMAILHVQCPCYLLNHIMRMSQNWRQWNKTFEQFCLLSGDILRKSGLLAFFSTLRPLQNRWYHPLSNATWQLFHWDILMMKGFSREKTECHGMSWSHG